jgi:hypothetical protein
MFKSNYFLFQCQVSSPPRDDTQSECCTNIVPETGDDVRQIFFRSLGWIQTTNPTIRSRVFFSVELRENFSIPLSPNKFCRPHLCAIAPLREI